MAVDFNEQLDLIRSKATVMVEKYSRLLKAFEEVREEANQLRSDLMARDKEIEQLRMKVEYLSIASTVKISGDDLEATRAMVADLVRDIDRCIADLND